MPQQRGAHDAGVSAQVRPPVPGRFRRQRLDLHPLEHQPVQFLL